VENRTKVQEVRGHVRNHKHEPAREPPPPLPPLHLTYPTDTTLRSSTIDNNKQPFLTYLRRTSRTSKRRDVADVVRRGEVPTHATLGAEHLLAHRARKLYVCVRGALVLPQLRLRRKLILAQVARKALRGLGVAVLHVEAEALFRAECLVALLALQNLGTACAVHGLLVVLDPGLRPKAPIAQVTAVRGELFAVGVVLVVHFRPF